MFVVDFAVMNNLARMLPPSSRKINSFASTVFFEGACPITTSEVTKINDAAPSCFNNLFCFSTLRSLRPS